MSSDEPAERFSISGRTLTKNVDFQLAYRAQPNFQVHAREQAQLLCVDFANLELQLLDSLSDGSLTPEDFARMMTKRVKVPFIVPEKLIEPFTQLDTEADRRVRKAALADFVTTIHAPVKPTPRRAPFRPPAPKQRRHS